MERKETDNKNSSGNIVTRTTRTATIVRVRLSEGQRSVRGLEGQRAYRDLHCNKNTWKIIFSQSSSVSFLSSAACTDLKRRLWIREELKSEKRKILLFMTGLSLGSLFFIEWEIIPYFYYSLLSNAISYNKFLRFSIHSPASLSIHLSKHQIYSLRLSASNG